MDVRGLLTEGFGRITELYDGVAEGLDDETLHHRPGGTGNPIAWLLWHLARVQDDHVADRTCGALDCSSFIPSISARMRVRSSSLSATFAFARPSSSWSAMVLSSALYCQEETSSTTRWAASIAACFTSSVMRPR